MEEKLREADIPFTKIDKKGEVVGKKVEKAKPSKKGDSDSEASEEEKPKKKVTKAKQPSKKKEESSSSSSSSESSEEEKPAPKKVEKKTAPVVSKPDVPPKPSALKVTRNSFGNLINAETGAVFASLMVGGRKTNVAIGIQNNETEKTGVESLLPLDKERVEICKKTGRKILDEEFFKTLSEEDQRTYKNLVYSDKKEEESDGEEDEGEESNDSSSEDDEDEE
jgi:nucleolin